MIHDSINVLQYLFLDFFDYFYHVFAMMHDAMGNGIVHFPGKLTVFMEIDRVDY